MRPGREERHIGPRAQVTGRGQASGAYVAPTGQTEGVSGRSRGSPVAENAQLRPPTLGRSLRSQVGWNLLVPFFVSLILSIVLFSLVEFIAVLFILGGGVLWTLSSAAESKTNAAAILIYGLAMAPAPTIFMILALVTTRNQ